MSEFFSVEECSATFERMRDVALNGGIKVLSQKDCAIAVTEIARLHDRIAALEADLQAALDTVHAWEGTTCGGDCLAAPCGSCDGTGRTMGKGGRLDAQVAELKGDLAALESELAQARAWKQAVDDLLATWHTTADSYATPREAVKALIAFEVMTALDPKVSSDAVALVEQGRKEEREACIGYVKQLVGGQIMCDIINAIRARKP